MAPTPISGWRIQVGEPEIARIAEGVRAGRISQGALTLEFERALAERLAAPFVLCVTSGTSALMMACLALGVGPGSEIIVPDRTWVATANAALLLGARVRLVDVEPGRPVIDPEGLEAAITEKTRAIVVVHLNGHGARMAEIQAIAERCGLPIVEDACQALFSSQGGRQGGRREGGQAERFLGTFGRFGCFSLGMAKLLTTGQGGFLVCHTQEDYERLARIRNQGLGGPTTDAPIDFLGGNFKFTDLQAAMGLAQLDRLPARIKRQRAIQSAYAEGLAGHPELTSIPVEVAAGEIPLRAEYLHPRRADFIAALGRLGIEAHAQPDSLHNYPHIAATAAGPHAAADFPHAQRYAGTLLTLPSGPDQPLENVARTIEAVRGLAAEPRGG